MKRMSSWDVYRTTYITINDNNLSFQPQFQKKIIPENKQDARKFDQNDYSTLYFSIAHSLIVKPPRVPLNLTISDLSASRIFFLKYLQNII